MCTDKLLTVDSSPVWISISGSSASALDGDELPLGLCGPDAQRTETRSGTHTVVATYGHANGAHSTGWDLDQLAFDSAPGEGPRAGRRRVNPSSHPRRRRDPDREGHVLHCDDLAPSGHRCDRAFLACARRDAEQGLGGFGGRRPRLGGSTLVDGFANGWKVDPAAARGRGTFRDLRRDARLGTPEPRLGGTRESRARPLDLPGAPVLPRRSGPEDGLGDLAVPPGRGAGEPAQKWRGRSLPRPEQAVRDPAPVGRPCLASPLSFPRARRPPVWIAACRRDEQGSSPPAFSTPWSPWAGLVVGPLAGLVVLLRWTRLLIAVRCGTGRSSGVYVASARPTTTTPSAPPGPGISSLRR